MKCKHCGYEEEIYYGYEENIDDKHNFGPFHVLILNGQHLSLSRELAVEHLLPKVETVDVYGCPKCKSVFID